MLNFKTAEIEDKEWFERLSKNTNNMGAEVPFGSCFVWEGRYLTRICEYKNFILKKYKNEGTKARYAFPIGNGDLKDAIAAMQEDASDRGLEFSLIGITQEHVEQLESMFPGEFEFKSNRDSAEYIYNSEDLAFLKGRKFHSKRNHINRFKEKYNYTTELITQENLQDAWYVSKKWCEENGCIKETGSESEACAIKKSFNNFDDIGFKGLLIRINGDPVSMAMGEEINKDTFVIHFEKAVSGYDGLYAAINTFFANELLDYKYLNREEDMGIEGLRKAKLSYRPAILLEKFEAVPVKKYAVV